MQYTIRHETRCRFDSPASYSIHQLRITPREEAGVRVARWEVSTPVRSSRSVDAWGNTTHLLTLTEPHADLAIVVTGVLELPEHDAPLLGRGSDALAPQIYLANTQLTQPGNALTTLARSHLGRPPQHIADVLALLTALNDILLTPQPGAEPLHGAQASFEHGSATAADRVHVVLGACRALGLPARFVSGYQLAAEAGAACWADIWLEGEGGWVSFDVLRAAPASGRLVRLAVGRDYLDACPVRAAHQGGGVEEVRVSLHAS